MSYNLLAEAPGGVDWDALQRRLKPELHWVEVFPIPRGGADASDALGLSVPAKGSSDNSYQETCRIAEILRQEFEMKVVDLQTSAELTRATVEQLRRNFLG
jgi:hypothetical protein